MHRLVFISGVVSTFPHPHPHLSACTTAPCFCTQVLCSMQVFHSGPIFVGQLLKWANYLTLAYLLQSCINSHGSATTMGTCPNVTVSGATKGLYPEIYFALQDLYTPTEDQRRKITWANTSVKGC